MSYGAFATAAGAPKADQVARTAYFDLAVHLVEEIIIAF